MSALRIVIFILAALVILLFRVGLVTLGCVVYVYLLPGVLAQKKGHPSYQRIYLLCATGGWLLIPWLAALIWAAAAPPVLEEPAPEMEW